MTNAPAPVARPENVARGTLVALLTIPVGVVLWVIIWNLGFIASIVSLGIAYLAMFLYRWASGGGFSRSGAIRVTIITLVTIGLAIFAGIVSSVAQAIVDGTGHSQFEAIALPQFWSVFNQAMESPEVQAELLPSVLIGIGFGLLGCFGVLRSAFKATSPVAAQAPTAGAVPQNYQPLVDMYNQPPAPGADDEKPPAPPMQPTPSS